MIAELVNAANRGVPYNTVIVDARGSRSDLAIVANDQARQAAAGLAFVLISPPQPDPVTTGRSTCSMPALRRYWSRLSTRHCCSMHCIRCYVSVVEDPQVANFIDHYAREHKVLQP